ncbi:PH domain-containing protein [Halegenticoccus tardaugens]|uniref:PH domain-containing protein n=1 Tax=Halegenticoccus tardaugens TaxID=2071624 RepID=UPI00100BF53E|nr:PH domain-containing protein [Halegenticoccus tardaugens]
MDVDPSFEWLTLDEDEEILWSSTPHRYSLAPELAVGIPLSLVLIGIPIVVAAYLSYRNTHYVVTTAGLYRKTGILSRDVQTVGFDKVQNISYNQTALGSALGYGNVDVSTAGSAGVELRFRNVPDPAAVQELIGRRTGSRADRTAKAGDGDDPSEVLDEILAELRAIRLALEAGRSATDDGDGDPDVDPAAAESPRNVDGREP